MLSKISIQRLHCCLSYYKKGKHSVKHRKSLHQVELMTKLTQIVNSPPGLTVYPVKHNFLQQEWGEAQITGVDPHWSQSHEEVAAPGKPPDCLRSLSVRRWEVPWEDGTWPASPARYNPWSGNCGKSCSICKSELAPHTSPSGNRTLASCSFFPSATKLRIKHISNYFGLHFKILQSYPW